MSRRVPYVPQLEIAECGAACLAMIAAFHGHHLPLAEARQLCRVSRDGSNAFAICEAASAIGLAPTAISLEPDELGECTFPCVVHWKMNHFVVLESLRAGGAWIVDPACGRTFVPARELSESFTGVVLLFERTSSFVRRAPSRPSFTRYRRLFGDALPSLGLVLGAVVLLEIVAFVLPASSQVVIDVVVRPRHERWLFVIGGVLLATIALRWILATLRDRVLAGLQTVLDVRAMRTFVDHLLSLPLAFFQHRSAGDLLARVGGLAALREVTAGAVLGTLDALLVLAYVALMFLYEPHLAAVVVVLAALRLLVLWRVHARTRDLSAADVTTNANEATIVAEAAQEPEAIKAFAMEHYLGDLHARRVAQRLNASIQSSAAVSRGAAILPALDGLSRAAIVWLGGREVVADRLSLGAFAAFLVLEAMIAPPLAALLAVVLKVQQTRERLARADEVWSATPEPRGGVDPGLLAGAIALEGVGFRYGASTAPVLSDVSVRLDPGRSLAIVGRSGAGKSTLAKLLCGLVDPSEGAVRFDGVDLRTLDRDRVRAQIGIVSQELFLFDDTVRANVCLGRGEIDTAVVEEALRAACLDDVVAALPQGLDTRIGPNGARLSGGQRQRLVLARALVRRPRILVLDEATSSLDMMAERRVVAHLDALRCTRVIIAHRLATIERADHVVVLDDGRIVDQGSYSELLVRPGLVREMVQACA